MKFLKSALPTFPTPPQPKNWKVGNWEKVGKWEMDWLDNIYSYPPYLDIIGRKISDAEFELLSQQFLLKNDSVTTHVMLAYNEMNDVGAEYLSRVLLKNTSIQNLVLIHNQIGDEGAKHLSNALLKHKSLQYVSFEANQIGDKGCEYIATVLLKNTTLQYLKLQWNKMGEKGELLLRNALQRNPSLIDFQGFELVKNVKNNTITLKKWRLELQQRRRKLVKILSRVVMEVNLLRSILLLESVFPF